MEELSEKSCLVVTGLKMQKLPVILPFWQTCPTSHWIPTIAFAWLCVYGICCCCSSHENYSYRPKTRHIVTYKLSCCLHLCKLFWFVHTKTSFQENLALWLKCRSKDQNIFKPSFIFWGSKCIGCTRVLSKISLINFMGDCISRAYNLLAVITYRPL